MPAAFDVAAGIINPVTGRWMTKSWRFDNFAAEAERFYREIEKELSIEIYHPIPEARFCLNAEDAKRAQRRIRNPRYANVLGGFTPKGEAHPAIQDEYGSFHIVGAAYVDLPKLVNALRAAFNSHGHLQDELFEHSKLSKQTNGWLYQDVVYRRVIFCEGAALTKNPWFGQLPLAPAKGETLLCRCKNLELPMQLIHHRKWILPYANGRFRIGATYDESDLSEDPTDTAAGELLSGFDAATTEPHQPEVVKHLAGIRPGTQDAHPFLGQHPQQLGLFIMNGLGSKGTSLAPTLSRELLEHIFEGIPLHKEADIARLSCD